MKLLSDDTKISTQVLSPLPQVPAGKERDGSDTAGGIDAGTGEATRWQWQDDATLIRQEGTRPSSSITRTKKAGSSKRQSRRPRLLWSRDGTVGRGDPIGGSPVPATTTTTRSAEETARASEAELYLPRGHVLGGRYTVLNVKNRGGFGVLYHCIDRDSHEFVLIKELFPSGIAKRNADNSISFTDLPARTQSLRNRFLSEIRILSTLNHPGVAKLLDFFEENSTIYFGQQLLSGQTLDDVIAINGTISLQTSFDILGRLCTSLEYVHRKGIIHCDIKPSNIFVQTSKLPVIIDFGAAMNTQQRFARDGSLLFTPAFCAPEFMASPDLINTWTDVFSLFSTVFFALTRRRVNAHAVYQQEEFPFFDHLDGTANQALREFFGRGLQHSFELRFQSVTDVLVNLDRVKSTVEAGYHGSRLERRKVFISYSRSDAPAAGELKKCLVDADFDVWIDTDTIRGGRSWAEQIDRGIRGCDVFLILCSSNSVGVEVSSANVLRELTLASDLNKRLLPVFIEETDVCVEARYFLARNQSVFISGIEFAPVLVALQGIF